ncbi:hypothetical protein PghCCS26_00600 [Paenibacillus glycanilyticus]|uniref:Ferric siderophore reductase C-terminal domain-containing protein n=1 Tax=Paenibacillus glycanilyticus TaxID=126569 RepID=A0ABQ6NE33_9BACL|nr:hypothetical protein [Paenibacillus glycanilyticus]GMK42933.1 hypothetical protein PghCCS26_00600 [Paenibacillus glycanilyticus]
MDLTIAETFFRISTAGSEAPLYSTAATELLDRNRMADLLTRYGIEEKATGPELAASFLGMGIYGLIAVKHMVLSQYNRVLDLSLHHLNVQYEKTPDGRVQFVFKLGEVRWAELPQVGRKEAIIEEWKKYFQEEINPIIEATAAAAGVKTDLIWNQYGSTGAFTMEYADSMFEGEVLQRYRDDFLTLCSLPGSVFNRRKNPFQHTPRYRDNPYLPGQKTMIRSACCMYDKREGGNKCFYCPVMAEAKKG